MAARWPNRLSGQSGARNGSRSDSAPNPRAGGPWRHGRAARSRQREHLADGVVEGADTGEARRERDVPHRKGGRFDEEPRRLSALGPRQGEWAGAQFGVELALDLACAVAEPRRKPWDALTVDHAVGDEPHRAGDDVRAVVPFR